MKKIMNLTKFHVIIAAIFLLSFNDQPEIQLLYPISEKVIQNNTPTLMWTGSDYFQTFEIWIDGIRFDSIKGSNSTYVPFPLSFGKHSWQIIGIKGKNKYKSAIEYFTITDDPLCKLPPRSALLRYNWKVKAACEVKEGGKELSTKQVNDNGWATTTIPATVLSALVRNGYYPNPYIGINNMFIPDINDSFNQQYNLLRYSHIKGKNPWKTPYWFCNTFEIPDSVTGKNYWITLNEINYKADIWLNGIKIADSSQVVGMERSFRFNVTNIIKKEAPNHIAIAIYPVEHPGMPDPEPLTPFGEPGTNMADGLISKDYTKWDVIGWDWQPPVRDRDMGITEDVFLSATDDIEIDDLYVTSDIPLPDTSQAFITISATLNNYSNKPKQGKIIAIIANGNDKISFEEPFSLKPNQNLVLYFDKNKIESLAISNPKLWWPIGYGQPNLYHLILQAKTSEGDVHIAETNFGIRKVETYIGPVERVYKINGKIIYPKGGNWVIDMMLNWTAQRYTDEIKLTQNSGLNILRIWGPTGAPPTAFYDAADKSGVLLWQDFLNDYWGTFRNTPGYLPDEKLFEQATIAIVKKYRNHPSLVIWCGGNEGPNPRENLIMEKILPQYDGRDSKHYLKISNGDGLHGGGPYHTLLPQDYFTHPKLMGFSSEIGPSGVPVFESVAKFITNLGEETAENAFPVNGQWAYHDATDRSSDDRKFSHYDNIVRNCYGKPTTTMDYFEKCQLVNYDVYRASIEAINRLLWDKASGIALWKSNSSWPSFTWQIYDWYLQAHAGYYGTKKASEMTHIQLNRDNMKIVVLNANHFPIENTTIIANLLDSSLKVIWSAQKNISLKPNSVNHPEIVVPTFSQTTLLVLKLLSKENKIISENYYWLNPQNNYTSLRSLPETKIIADLTASINDSCLLVNVNLKNAGSGIALMTQLSLVEKNTKAEILPTYFSDNYLTILPNESKQITIQTRLENLPPQFMLQVKSYNNPNVKYFNINNPQK